MNKVLVGVVAGAVVVGAAGFGTLVYPQMRAKQQVDQAIAALPKEIRASYQTLDYSLFGSKLVIGGLEVTAEEDGETLTTRLSTVTLGGLSKTKVATVSGSGLSVEDSDHTMRMDVAELNGEQIEAPEGLSHGMATPAAFSLKRLALSGVSMVMGEEKVALREIVLADYAQTAKVPLSMTLGLHGMDIDPKSLPDQDARDGLARLGYDKLSLNFDLSYAHSPEAKRLSIKQASVGGENVGRLSFSVDLAEVDAAGMEDPAVALAVAQKAMLESAELRYDDASLAGRLLKVAAEEAQMDESQFKAMLLAQLAEAGAQAPASPLTKQALDSATAFVTDPKSLSLRLKPTPPLPVGVFVLAAQDPYSLAQALGASVSANR